MNRIRDRYHNVLAARIQHGYRKYKARKLAKTAPVSKIRRSSNLAKVLHCLCSYIHTYIEGNLGCFLPFGH